MLLLAAAAAHGAAWVLDAETDRDLRRAVRVVRRADPDRLVPLGPFTTCAEFEEELPERFEAKLTRRLGHPPEERLDCDVAWFGLGRGWIGIVLDQPAEGLEQVMANTELAYVQISRPGDPELPVLLCVARGSLPEPMALADHLEAAGLPVRGVYEVGSCKGY